MLLILITQKNLKPYFLSFYQFTLKIRPLTERKAKTMNVNIFTNILAILILFLSVFYVFLVFPAVDYFQLVLAFFLSVSNFITGKGTNKNDYF